MPKSMTEVELLGITIPLWAIILLVILIVIIVWKLVKFAIKIALVIILFFLVLLILDTLGVFTWIHEHLLSPFL